MSNVPSHGSTGRRATQIRFHQEWNASKKPFEVDIQGIYQIQGPVLLTIDRNRLIFSLDYYRQTPEFLLEQHAALNGVNRSLEDERTYQQAVLCESQKYLSFRPHSGFWAGIRRTLEKTAYRVWHDESIGQLHDRNHYLHSLQEVTWETVRQICLIGETFYDDVLHGYVPKHYKTIHWAIDDCRMRLTDVRVLAEKLRELSLEHQENDMEWKNVYYPKKE